MTNYNFTDEEITVLVQGLRASIHRLRHKIANDARHERNDKSRVRFRTETITICEQLISKMEVYEPENI